MPGTFKQLEDKFCDFTGQEYAVSTNTGTAALHLALASLGIKKGDEVIVPEFTMAATAFAVSYTGATPVFVDCDKTLNIDVSKLKPTKRTKAIMVTHVYGQVVDIEPLRKFGLPIIEDACEAHGADVGKGDITCYSFYKNKIVHAEEGGMLMTNDKRIADKARSLKCMAFGEVNPYDHTDIGFNYRMSDAQADLALSSLECYRHEVARRHLKMADLRLKYAKYAFPMAFGSAPWVFPMLCKTTKERDKMLKKLAKDYTVRPFFVPMSGLKPYFNNTYKKTRAYDFSRRGLYISLL